MLTNTLVDQSISTSAAIYHTSIAGLNGIPQVDPSRIMDYVLIGLWLVFLPVSISLINRTFTSLFRIIENWRFTRLRAFKFHGLELKIPNRFTDTLLLFAKGVRAVAIVLLVTISLILVFSIFPQTRGFVQGILSKVLQILQAIGGQLLSFVPNLIAMIVIIVITYYTLRVLRFLSDGFKKGKVKLTGVHPDLVEPTFQIIRFLVIALAIVAAYPYIPGSESPAFRYISLFLGFLLSLGSTSLVSNIVAGIVLTYTRGMKIGDRVQIADTVGDVVDRTLLVTRIRTIKNVVITIPNGLVLNNHIINFSSSAQEMGLILNTGVTIGYDVPWRQVHMLLIEAARATEHILEEPEPFVFQTSLNDYYVSYELNAYTQVPEEMAATYSELHQNIQDYFNTAGVEIMSPAYSAWRDGNASTIPVDHQPVDTLQNFMRGFPVGVRKSNP